MSVSLRHARHQGRNLATLGRIALSGLSRRPSEVPATPGTRFEATVDPLPAALRDDFARWCGADPTRWAAEIPPWMFPQWGLPLLARTLDEIPWPVARTVNQGCRITRNAPLPVGVPLQVTAQLVGIEHTERRARMHQRLTTGPADAPESLVADVYAVVPLAKPGSGGARREPPTVGADHERVGGFDAKAGAGWEFALLTGDFNPLHWLGPYAKIAGFGGVILHGFGTLARSAQIVLDTWLGGDPCQLSSLDVRFVRPLRLPASPSVFLGPADGDTRPLSVGDAPGATARVLGSVTRSASS